MACLLTTGAETLHRLLGRGGGRWSAAGGSSSLFKGILHGVFADWEPVENAMCDNVANFWCVHGAHDHALVRAIRTGMSEYRQLICKTVLG